MRNEDLMAWIDSDSGEIKPSRLEEWAEMARHMTATERLAIGDDLRRYMYSLHPDWPTAEQRAEDLTTHIRVSECLRSVKVR